MSRPCVECRSADNLDTTREFLLGVVGQYKGIAANTWDAAAEHAEEFNALAESAPEVPAYIQQSHAALLTRAASVIEANGEAADLIEAKVAEADAIDCQATGCDLQFVCPRFKVLKDAAPAVKELRDRFRAIGSALADQ